MIKEMKTGSRWRMSLFSFLLFTRESSHKGSNKGSIIHLLMDDEEREINQDENIFSPSRVLRHDYKSRRVIL